jgi:hypothetical protein
MRDLQRIEKLSASAALGLWADDVVMALDRATHAALTAADRTLLNEAAEIVELTQSRTSEPLTAPESQQALTATDATLAAVAVIARRSGLDEEAILTAIAKTVRDVASQTPRRVNEKQLASAMSVFATVGEHQLDESSSVLSSRQDARQWTAMHTISSCS